jgi:hypothetical protein
VWNLRYPHPEALSYGVYGGLQKYVEFYGTQDAVPGVTPRDQPLGPLVVPGDYTIALTVNGQTYRQTLHVVKDPRVPAAQYDYVAQFNLIRRMTNGMSASYDAFGQADALHTAVEDRLKSLKANAQAKDAVDAAMAFEKKLDAVQNVGNMSPGFGAVNSILTQEVYAANMGDGAPPETVKNSTSVACAYLDKDFEAWRNLNAQDLPALNTLLQKYNLAPLTAAQIPASAGCGK